MSDGDLARLERLFQAAVDLPVDERAAFLDRECEGEPALRRRLEAMLASAEGDPSLVRPMSATPVGPPAEEAGTSVGRYKLRETLGEGGFGVVWLAEQEQPVRRRVALKILKPGMDTREVVARFAAESQALALMDHPNIARVFDGGVTDSGRPYFVMELVRGVSITDYCDQSRLGAEERLALFLDVCAAVEHAHQKGVIHRDLKPSNVLVRLDDGEPVVKVIDFGIAKALHGRLTEATVYTRAQQFVGTPAYMSPEQAERSGLDVDTRTDIYALGVLLYELLTGSTPFDTRALFDAGLSEMQRVLRETPPQKPSQRVSTSEGRQVAERRRLDPASLRRRLQGDLDWIILKALEKERGRRYPTAGELAEDVRRHLRDEPVVAGPPSRVYRLRKFVARNRFGVLSAVLVTGALLLGMLGTGLGFLEASRQRDAASKEAVNASNRAEDVRHMTDYLVELLSLADPQVALSPEVSVRELLARAADRLPSSFEGQPAAQARIRGTIGRAYLSMGEHRAAEQHLQAAIELYEQLEQPELGDYYAVLWAMTNAAFKLERTNGFEWAGRSRRVAFQYIAETQPKLSAALEEFHTSIERGAHQPDPGSLHAGVALGKEAERLADELLPPKDALWKVVAETFMAAGYWTWYTPNESAGIQFFQAAVRIQDRELEPGHPSAAESTAQLAGMLNRGGRPAEAEALLRRKVESLAAFLSADNFQRAFVESILGETLVSLGRLEEARDYLLPSHEVILARVLHDTDFYAIDSFRRVLSLWDRLDPEKAGPVRAELARRCAQGPAIGAWAIVRPAFDPRSQAELLAALDLLNERLGPMRYSLKQDRSATGPVQEVEEQIDRFRRALGELDPARPQAVIAAAVVINLMHGLAGPELVDRVAPTLFEVLRPASVHPFRRAEVYALESDRRRRAGDEAAALAAAREAAQRVTEAGEASWFTALAVARTGRALQRCGRPEQGESFLRAALEVTRTQLGPQHPETTEAARWLADCLREQGREDEARRLVSEDPIADREGSGS